MRPLSRPDFNTSKPSRPGAFARRGWPNFWTPGCASRRPCAYRQMAPLGRWIKARRSISIAANSMPGGPKLSSPAIGWSLPTDCIRQRSSRLGCQTPGRVSPICRAANPLNSSSKIKQGRPDRIVVANERETNPVLRLAVLQVVYELLAKAPTNYASVRRGRGPEPRNARRAQVGEANARLEGGPEIRPTGHDELGRRQPQHRSRQAERGVAGVSEFAHPGRSP
jgi:hypothetical protein